MKPRILLFLFATIANIGFVSAGWENPDYKHIKVGNLYYNCVINPGTNNGDAWVVAEGEAPNNYAGLTTINIPNTISYGGYTFYVKRIDYKAFAGCGLKEIEIPSKGLEEIEDLAFQDCYNLMNFTIPETVKKIGLNPFMGASSINNIESLSPYFDTDADCLVENETIISYYGTTDIVDLKTIPGHITTIGAFAFYKHTNIQEIRFPLELSSIGTNAFLGCFNIKKVKCAGNPKDIKIESGNENITKNL